MNKIYKVIWSHVKQCYVVTSELVKAHGRTSTRGRTSRLAVAALTAFILTAGVTSVGLADTVTDNSGNTITSTDSKKATELNANITGKNNKVTDSSNAEIVGDTNTVTNKAVGEDGSVRYVRSNDARIHGSGNTISASRNQQVVGDNNTIMGRDDGTVTDYQHPEGREPNVSDLTIGRGNFIRSTDTYRNEWDSLKVIGNNNRADFNIESAGGPAAGIVIGDNQNIDGIQDSIVIGSLSPSEQQLSPSGKPKEKNEIGDLYSVGANSIIIGYHTKIKRYGEGIVVGNRSQGSGVYQTIMGSRSIIGSDTSDPYSGSGAIASIYGAFNKIEDASGSVESAADVDGVGNSINGSLNITSNARGTMIMGVGNTVTHAKGPDILGKDEDTPGATGYWVASGLYGASYYAQGADTEAEGNNLNIYFDEMRNSWQKYMETSGGAVSVLGNSNNADYAIRSQILGTGNTLQGSETDMSAYNTVSGFANTGTNIKRSAIVGTGNTLRNGEDNVVIGDYHNLENGKHNVILGSMDSTEKQVTKQSKSAWAMTDEHPDGTFEYTVTEQVPVKEHKNDIENAVMVGYNTDVTQNGGVALGSDSIASTEAGKTGYDAKGKTHAASDKDYTTWVSTDAAVSVGRAEEKDEKTGEVTSKAITRQITNLAAGTQDTDAVNVAQLKAISNTVDASKTKYYSVNDSAPGAIFDNEEFEKHYTNKNNDGAKSYYAMAAGYGTYAAGDASTVIGSYSVIQNDKVKDGDDEDLSPQGATAVSVGSFNFNLNTTPQSANDFSKWYSGTANSIVGQGNLTKDSNGVLIYGAGNKITNSYRGDVPINMLVTSMNPDVYQNPESFMDKVGEAVLQSGGQVMAIGGGNVADKAYMTQLMGVGNKVQGTDITFTPPELQNDEENYERYITAFNSAFNTQATRLNYVDGFYNKLTNAKNDYVIGMANDISGDDVSSNKSNIVIGDFHQMRNGSNNVILGSQDGNLTQKRYNTDGTLVTEESVNRFTHQENLEDAVMIGHNADVLKNGGVAIGAGSVAVIDKDQVGYDPANGDHQADTTGTWKSKAAAVSVGDASKNITRQITNVAAGTQDTDAVNVAQLKAASSTISNNITASKTKYYSVQKIPFTETQLGSYAGYTNEANDGAKEMGALSAGYMTYAGGIASTVTGSLSGIINRAAAPGSKDFRGATALSYGTFNINNNSDKSGAFSGVANSIVGQANMTTDSNAALIYGAGNVISNSYRDIDISKMGAITSNLKDPKALGEALQAAVPTSGGQVMAFGGGNVVDNAYMTQVIGVGNTVKGNQKKNDDGTADDTSSQLNYVDGFYTTLINGKNDYLIGAHNTVTGDSVENNHSNIVIGDNHTLENQSNNIILGSAASALPTTASQVTILGHNANATVDGGVALGYGSIASTDKEVAGYDPLTGNQSTLTDDIKWKSNWAAASIGDSAHTRQLTNVAAGWADTDAVNVAQLRAVMNLPVHIYNGGKFANNVYKDGDQIATDMTISNLQFDFGDGLKAQEVGSEGDKRVLVTLDKDALKDDPDFKGPKGDKGDTGAQGPKGEKGDTGAPGKDGKDGKDGGVGTVVGDEMNITVANTETDPAKPANYKVSLNKEITVDKVTAGNTTISSDGLTITGGPSITKSGIDAGGKKVTHVADGEIAADSKDAVNGSQLYRVQKNVESIENNVTNLAGDVTNLNGRVSDLDNRVNKVGAGAAALAALHPLDFNPDDKWNFAVGYGNYRNANSVAVGAFYQPNENTMFNVATNFGNGENMINAGVSFKIGKGNSYAGISKAQLVAENQQLKENDALQDQKIQKQDQEIQELKKALEELKSRIK
ncbi:hypothetical protein DW949_07990 [Megasphaera sp. AM44-1BH]|uniref:ESPR-type extended signal peptide-containing protein n=1 Tax=Megasphaera sp. AM44-1BH TaxID=2292358 RepID=UPI000E545594|nr:ESPR-type extended signal peptide-containing protein [Megasphaera sp. AM44-1BH]RHA12150.1 hypothetical protein DW949_07990 [Megasphaera sp. AM44-1BH]